MRARGQLWGSEEGIHGLWPCLRRSRDSWAPELEHLTNHHAALKPCPLPQKQGEGAVRPAQQLGPRLCSGAWLLPPSPSLQFISSSLEGALVSGREATLVVLSRSLHSPQSNFTVHASLVHFSQYSIFPLSTSLLFVFFFLKRFTVIFPFRFFSKHIYFKFLAISGVNKYIKISYGMYSRV